MRETKVLDRATCTHSSPNALHGSDWSPLSAGVTVDLAMKPGFMTTALEAGRHTIRFTFRPETRTDIDRWECCTFSIYVYSDRRLFLVGCLCLIVKHHGLGG